MDRPKAASSPLRVLLLEDNPEDSELSIRKLRRAGFQISAEISRNAGEFKKELEGQAYDLILGDFRLPDWNGLETIRWLRASGITTPFILVTGALGDELAIECIKTGADDYVLKDNLDRLAMAVRRVLEERRLRWERDWAERELRESEKHYRLLFHSNPHPMWVFDEETFSFLAVNAAAVRHYGYSFSEFLSMSVKDIRPEEGLGYFVDGAQQDPRSGSREPSCELWKHKKKDGTIIDVEISSQPITFRATKAKLVLAQDVTAQRKLELELRHVQKMEAVGRLAGGVAHDFNNLLMVISSHAQLVRGRIRNPSRIDGDISQIMAAVERAALLAKQLLAFSRKQHQELQVLNLNTLINESCEMLRSFLGPLIELTLRTASTECLIYSDKAQFEQVMMNLAVNARDAMPRGGVITVETSKMQLDRMYFNRRGLDVNPGNYVVLAVTDTGTGMDSKTKAHIFEPFFTTKEAGKGTGLGLSTVYGIVKQSNGYIWVYSEVGKGTTFKMYFPSVEAEVEAVSPVPEEEGETTGRETILLVEDEAALRAATAEFLESKGYFVLQAGNATEAIRACLAHRGEIHLLLTDLVMPGLGGIELSSKISEHRPSIQVVYMSGYTERTSRTEGLEASRIFLEKPFSLSRLATTIRRTLESSSRKQAATPIPK